MDQQYFVSAEAQNSQAMLSSQFERQACFTEGMAAGFPVHQPPALPQDGGLFIPSAPQALCAKLQPAPEQQQLQPDLYNGGKMGQDSAPNRNIAPSMEAFNGQCGQVNSGFPNMEGLQTQTGAVPSMGSDSVSGSWAPPMASAPVWGLAGVATPDIPNGPCMQQPCCPSMPVKPQSTSDEFSSEHDEDSTWTFSSRSDSGSQFSPTGSSGTDCNPADKKKKHNLVEQNRREKTRAMVAELQDIVGCDGGSGNHPNISMVLAGTLKYIQDAGETMDKSANGTNGSDSLALVSAASQRPPRVEEPERWLGAFNSAPFGIALATIHGKILKVNEFAERFLHLPKGFVTGKIMCCLTAPYHMPLCIQATNELLQGKKKRLRIVKDCIGGDGIPQPCLVELCSKWGGSPPVIQAIIVYIKPVKDPAACLPSEPLSTDGPIQPHMFTPVSLPITSQAAVSNGLSPALPATSAESMTPQLPNPPAFRGSACAEPILPPCTSQPSHFVH